MPDKIDDQIRVMPKVQPGGDVTKPATASSMQPPKPITPQEPDEQTRSWPKIVIGIVLASLVAASGYFLYSAYKPEEEEAAPIQEQTETEETTEPGSQLLPGSAATEEAVATADEETETVATTEVISEIVPSAREDFEHNIIRELTLEMASSTDSDDDGLTDVEERLFGTESQNADTDEDTFSDGQEVINLYDPNSIGGATLGESDKVKTYTNTNYKYTVMHPASWFVKSTDKANLEVVFTSENNEFVSIWVEENPDDLSLTDWFTKQAPDIEPNEIIEFINKKGIIGLKSPDGYTMYFAKDDFVYIMHYSIGLKEKADFPSVYKMMIESFNFIVDQLG